MLKQQHTTTLSAPAKQLRLPPGPTEQYSSADDLLHWMHENFARYGDIFKASLFGRDVYVVSAPEYCERILRWNWQNYERKGQVVKRIALLLGNGLIASNGTFWASQRRMIQPALSKTSISGLISLFTTVNLELLRKWKRAAKCRETVNVTRDVSFMVLKLTLLSIFGEDYALIAPHFNILVTERTRDLEFAQAFSPMGKIIREIAARRRQCRITATDILSKLMQARDRERGEPMSDAQLAKEVMTLIVAGHETTAGLLNWLWYLLATHQDAQAKLSAELDRIPWAAVPTMDMLSKYVNTRQIIDEALRLYPPLWLMTRRAVNDDHLGGFFVPAGTEIYISPYLIQRNPLFWVAPNHFDPDRMSRDKVLGQHELSLCPFGAGPRNCIGEIFARVEIQIHLMMFARELWLRYDHQKPPEITTGMNLLSKHDFIMLPEFKGRQGRRGLIEDTDVPAGRYDIVQRVSE
jgi:cytochrome P450